MQTAVSSNALSASTAVSGSDRIPAKGVTCGVPARKPNMRIRIDRAHVPKTRDPCAVEPAIQGNHLAIQRFLQRTLHRPSIAEFNSSTLRPSYQSTERLIVKNRDDRSIEGHVQLEPQTIRFGRSEIPVARLRNLAVLPEHRQQGYDGTLLGFAEAEAKRNGAMLMLTQGEDSKLLKSNGWVSLGSDPVSIVSPQRLLGQLPPVAEPESPFYQSEMPTWQVRIGRLTDVESLRSIYERVQQESYGGVVRDAEKWSWMISKRAHDRIYLFIENDEPLAYVIVRGASLIELMDLTNDGRGAARMLERVGADAIDQGRYSLRIHCPLTSPVHDWADLAGGQVFAAAVEDSWMVKILSKRTLLRRLAHEMHRRKPASLTELGVRIGNEELLIKKGVRSMKVTRGSSTLHHVGLTNRAASQLFLGYRTADELLECKELVASNEKALQMARELFPAVMLWRTRWDDAPVINS